MYLNERRTQMILQKWYLYYWECYKSFLGFILWLFILNVTLSVWSYLALVTEKKKVSSSEKLEETERILQYLLKHPDWNKTKIEHLFSAFHFELLMLEFSLCTKKCVSALVEIFALVGGWKGLFTVTKISG